MLDVNDGDPSTDSDYYDDSDDPEHPWICWDFGEMRVRLTHYQKCTSAMESWILHGSVDGKTWKILDCKIAPDYFSDASVRTFAVSDSVECRFIRLTQTDKGKLVNQGFEFFGTLLE
jgi:hypothetical protein